jgi:hypothetical protein
VLLKVYAEPSKLELEAERMSLRLRLRRGGFCPFHRSIRQHFLGTGDQSCIFRSSERQLIIDHVIRAQRPDGGAGLPESSPLGATLVARFPLHMRARLQLLEPWIKPWLTPGPGVVTEMTVAQQARADIDAAQRAARARRQHRLLRQIQGAQRLGLGGDADAAADAAAAATAAAAAAAQAEMEAAAAAAAATRTTSKGPASGLAAVWHFVSSFFSQPLDAIAEYFGEQIAFQFAWLEFYAKVCPWMS